jgi:hypothetical protein
VRTRALTSENCIIAIAKYALDISASPDDIRAGKLKVSRLLSPLNNFSSQALVGIIGFHSALANN